MSHTQGILAIEEVASDSGHIKHLCPVDREGMSLLTVVENDGVKFAAVYNDDDARRLVACWNACDILPTETLEIMGSLSDAIGSEFNKIKTERDSLRAVNAELLEAMEEIVSNRDKNANGPEQYVPKSASASVSYWSPSATMVHSEYIAKARAAIASARKQGEQP